MIVLEIVFKKLKCFYVIILKERFVCNLKITCPTGDTLNCKLENGLERKKIVCIAFWEDVGVFQKDLKIEERADKWE